jgi:hypothetical protein
MEIIPILRMRIWLSSPRKFHGDRDSPWNGLPERTGQVGRTDNGYHSEEDRAKGYSRFVLRCFLVPREKT